MASFTIYNSEGMILRNLSIPEEDAGLQLNPGEFLYSGYADPLTQKINPSTGEPEVMTQIPGIPILPVSLIIFEEVWFTSLPDPCWITINNADRTEITGGTLELSFEYPGTYVVRFSADNYLNTEVTIEVSLLP